MANDQDGWTVIGDQKLKRRELIAERVGVQQSSQGPDVEVMEGSTNLTRTDVLELARPDAGSPQGNREQKTAGKESRCGRKG